MTELHGFLDHLRENLQILDEQIENARAMSKEKGTGALQWAKTLRDLVQLRNETLDKIKSHLLGRDETGTVKEPLDFHSSQTHPLTLFERRVHDYLAKPWTVEGLRIKCEKCVTESETTQTRHYERYTVSKDYSYIQRKSEDLCDPCYEKNLEQLLINVKAAREKNGWNLSD
ncbi:hypothetical protein D4R54_01130 [archaeon]|nr:MAG: hypothetical protein D4R54_01130 [archaeon]